MNSLYCVVACLLFLFIVQHDVATALSHGFIAEVVTDEVEALSE
jgi:hypothetical protein